MQEAMLASVEEFPLRIWIIDNSGSMQSGDGHVLEQKAGTEALVGCTRWQELGDALRWHARMAAYMSAPTEFRFLNPPSGGLQTMHCGTTADPESEIRALESVLACGPRGLTPLCAQIRQVCVVSPPFRSVRVSLLTMAFCRSCSACKRRRRGCGPRASDALSS